MPHRGENKRNSTLRCTKTGGIQPKLNVACFVQSCLTDADFVIFSNYCLIGTRQTAGVFCVWMTGGRECASAPERVPLPGRTALNTAALLREECGRGEGRKAAAVHQKQKARRRPPARCRSLRQHLPQPANIPAAPAQWEKRGGLRR